MSTNNFRFFTDSISISKAKDKNGKDIMRLGGIASTRDQDADGEFLDTSGFDTSYLEKEGIVNWHHGAKTNPEAIIGEPSKVEKRTDGLYIEVDLYPESAMAKNVYKLAQVLEKNSKSRRLGFSIEGKATERDPANSKVIKKAAITGVAITHMPKNPNTLAQIIKGEVEDDFVAVSTENLEEINKSLKDELNKAKIALAEQVLDKSCTSEIDMEDLEEDEDKDKKKEKALSTDSSSGKALKKEHVDGQLKNLTKGEVYSQIFKQFPKIDINKAKKIEQIIKTVTNMSGRKFPTDKDIEKSFKILGIESDDDITLEKCISIGIDILGEEGKTFEDVEKALLLEGAEDDMITKSIEEIKKGVDSDEDEAEDDDSSDEDEAEDDDSSDEDEGYDRGEEEEEEEEVKKSWKKDGDNEMFLKKGEHYEKYLKKGSELVKADDFTYMKKGYKYEKMDMEKAKSEDFIKGILDEINTVSSNQNEISKAIGTVLKDIKDDSTTQMAMIEQIVDRIDSLEKGGRATRKSLPKSTYVDREFDGDDLAKGGYGEDTNTLSITRDKQKVLNILEKATFAPVEKGGVGLDRGFEKALTTFETSGMISGDIAARVKKEFGVTLTK